MSKPMSKQRRGDEGPSGRRRWRVARDEDIRHYYTRQCPCVTQDTFYFSPDFFENNTPGCPECGTFMIYDHTEVR